MPTMLKEQLLPNMPTSPTSSLVSAGASVAKTEMKNMRQSVKASVGLESEEEKQKRLQAEKERKERMVFAHSCVAAFTMAVCFGAVSIANYSITKISMMFPVWTAPYSVRQRRKRYKGDNLRRLHEKLRDECSHLISQNGLLQSEIDQLKTKVAKVKDVEHELGRIVDKQGTDAESFVNLVKENKKIHKKMRKLLEGQVLQEVVSAVLRCDHNKDMEINEAELQILCMRIQHLHGVPFTTFELRRRFALHKSNTMMTLMSIVRELMAEPKEETESKMIFDQNITAEEGTFT